MPDLEKGRYEDAARELKREYDEARERYHLVERWLIDDQIQQGGAAAAAVGNAEPAAGSEAVPAAGSECRSCKRPKW